MDTLLEVRGLSKAFGRNTVVNNLSFSIYEKEILCLLGPNGAGKSTTINILTGALGFDSGELFFYQKKLKKNDLAFKRKIGIVPQDLALYEELSLEEMAKGLFISEATVKTHILNIYRKFEVNSRVAAVEKGNKWEFF